MSTSEFLRSSPARDDNDYDNKKPIISTQTPLHNKISSIPLTKSSTSLSLKNQQQQTQQGQQQFTMGTPSITASASKYINQSLNLSGWTPLISKTYSSEQLLLFNSTPNKLVFSNSNNNNNNSNTSINDLDFQGFGLTPFINHNINVLGSATSANQFNPNFTPYHERIFQNTNDFYIDSPIRFGMNNGHTTNNNNNPNLSLNQDIQAITPSKFNLNNVANKKILQDPLKSATKRSIALLDTPPRQPHKLSITTKAEKNEIELQNETIGNGNGNENDKENQNPNLENNKLKVLQKKIEIEVEKEDDEEEEDDDEDFDKKAFLQTPSKVLRDVSNKPRIQFQTPAKQKLLAASSPSTIIISSPAKGEEDEDKNNDDNKGKSSVVIDIDDDKDDDEPLMVPPSPTPAKNLPKKPIMGVFSEKKSNSINGNQNLFSHFNNNGGNKTNNKTSDKSKNKTKNHQLAPQPPASASASESQSTETTLNFKNNKKKAANKAKMQAGMNKFQIVLTDVHTLMNKKKRNTKDDDQKKQHQPPPPPPQQQQKQKEKQLQTDNNKSDKRIVSKQSTQSLPPPPAQSQAPTLTTTPQLTHQLSSLQDHNITMNSSKDHSSIISAGNNSMNTSHFNITTDHSSFEFGGLSSTPNSKFLLDKIFEKPSPQTNYFLLQQQQQQQQHQIQQIQQMQQLQQIQQQLQQIILMIPTQDGSSNSTMPPPGKQQQQQQQQQSVQFIASQFPLMTMTMSTPQHHGVINYTPQFYNTTTISESNIGSSTTTSGDGSGSSNGNSSQGTSPDGLYNYGNTPQGMSMFHNGLQFGQSRSGATATNNNLPQYDE